uniref:Uncharacterized protein n=1 Tax=Romanomermis culicivorax TaxID=13658 RepID=A0A915KCW4_ROMCU
MFLSRSKTSRIRDCVLIPRTSSFPECPDSPNIRLVATSIRTRTSTVAPTWEKEEKQGLMYSIPMEPYWKVYIGETG